MIDIDYYRLTSIVVYRLTTSGNKLACQYSPLASLPAAGDASREKTPAIRPQIVNNVRNVINERWLVDLVILFVA